MGRSKPAYLNLAALILIPLLAIETGAASRAFGWFQGASDNIASYEVSAIVFALALLILLGLRLFSRWRAQIHGSAEAAHDPRDAFLAEGELRADSSMESENRFRGLFEDAPLGLYRISISDGKFLEANVHMAQMFGYENPGEFVSRCTLGKSFADEDAKGKMRAALHKGGRFKNFEAELFRKDGSVVWVRFSGRSYPERDCLEGAAADITKERQALLELNDTKACFRTITEAASDSIYIKDRHLKYTSANPATETYFGIPPSKLIGLTDDDLFGREAGTLIRDEDLRVLNGETVEEDVAGPNGIPAKTYSTIRVPIRDSSGSIVGLCGIARDISERRLLEDQLILAQKMEAVGTMASGLAHDFNNLLQAIQGFADFLLLDKSEGDPDYQEIREIHRAAKRGSELTKKLLNYSRRDEGTRRPVDLNYLIQQVGGFLERTIPKMIQIEVNLDDDIMLVNVDPVQIEQVLMNLAVNAKDAMPDRGRLTILTKNVSLDEELCRNNLDVEPGHYVMLSVSDTGHGMDDETMARIFEPFFSTKEPGKGTGLGLASVYGIVKGHGGHIVCISQPNMGTTFNVYLPAIMDGVEDVEAMESAPPAPKGEGTVLLVDDEKPIRSLGKRTLTSFGYSVLTASDGESALDIYRREGARIDLVILDLIMPGMGGKNCLKELLQINPGIKVLVASGCLAQQSADDCLGYGASDFIGKPYDMTQIITKVREVLYEKPL